MQYYLNKMFTGVKQKRSRSFFLDLTDISDL